MTTSIEDTARRALERWDNGWFRCDYDDTAEDVTDLAREVLRLRAVEKAARAIPETKVDGDDQYGLTWCFCCDAIGAFGSFVHADDCLWLALQAALAASEPDDGRGE